MSEKETVFKNECKLKLTEWSEPDIVVLKTGKTLSNFNDTIVDNEEGSSGS